MLTMKLFHQAVQKGQYHWETEPVTTMNQLFYAKIKF